MRILMLGNSFTASNDLPQRLAQLTGAEVMAHTRGGARLAEQLNPKTKLGARTLAALEGEPWDFVILQEMSHGPISSPQSFFTSVKRLCEWIHAKGATPVLFATWAYEKGGAKLAAKGWDYEDMARQLSDAYRQAAQENHALLARWASGSTICPPPILSTLPTASTPMRKAPSWRQRCWRKLY